MSKTVASFIRQCVTCRRLRKAPEGQRMSDLPAQRIEPSPPFTHSGMDCFGPFLTTEGRKQHKRSLSSQNRTFDLATLITDEDHEYVRSKISGQVWIGLRFLGDRWVWVGGEQLQYDDLKTCPVISRCGVVDKNRSTRYSILKCNVENDFFCYRKSPA
uniref:C-type lectin domain-containing protein n=1 Tax=Knipowitschia caucasica TaxID=637954 RepID=A0AAV2KKT9_KNICA